MIGTIPKILLVNKDKWKYENDKMVAVGTVTSDIQQAIEEQNKIDSGVEKTSFQITKADEDIEAAKEYYKAHKKDRVAKTFSELMKFNPYHDRLGRFTTGGNFYSFTQTTRNPKKQYLADMAIARQKNKVEQAKKDITRTAKAIAKEYGVENDKEAIKDISDCYEKAIMTNSIMYNQEKNGIVCRKKFAENELQNTVKKILSKQEYEDAATSQEYKDLRQAIKNTPIKISDYDKKDIPDWNDYRKSVFGNMTISNKGIPIDSFYQELSSRFPHLFNSNSETSPSDQLKKINDTLKALKPKKHRLSGYELESASKDMMNDMIKGYVLGILKAA